jgi:DNA-binding ferritin-like protein
LAERGVAESIIERILNHSEPEKKVTQRYNRYAYDKEKKEALSAWENHIASLTTPTKKLAERAQQLLSDSLDQTDRPEGVALHSIRG